MNSLRTAALIALIALAGICAAAQISGRVVDAHTGEAVPGATLVAGDNAAISDGKGYFKIQQPVQPEQTIFARAPGYLAGQYPAGELAGRSATLRLVPFTPKALYLTVYGIGSQRLRTEALDVIRARHLNAIVIDVKGDRGLIPYPSGIPLAKLDGARSITTIPNLVGLVQQLHHDGLYAIARIVVFKDAPLATYRPDLAVNTTNGRLYRDNEGLEWTDPFKPEVRNYNIAVAVEAARAGFNEIQFDYVRFPDIAERLRFAQPATEAARVAAIDAFLAEARAALRPFNVYLSVDIFGYVCWNTNDTGIGQTLNGILRYVDYISPMLYPSCFYCGIPRFTDPVAHPYEIVYNTLTNALRREHVSPKHFRPWLQAFRDYAFDRRNFDAAQIEAQIRAARDIGTDGWMLWNPRNLYDNVPGDN